MKGVSVAVIGAGVMGLSAARALIAAGAKVTLYEQGAHPNPLGSSVDQHRLIRYPYGAERGYTRMVQEAFGEWAQLWQDLGRGYYVETGTLAFDCPGQSWAAASAKTLEQEGIAFETLSGSEIRRRFPMITPIDVATALYLPSGGILLAEQIVAALAAFVMARGARLISRTKVAEVDLEAGRLHLADGRSERHDLVVMAAGPWIGDLLAPLAGKVTASRQVVVYLAPPPNQVNHWAKGPVVLAIDPAAGFYVAPPAGGQGLKVGDHRFSLDGHPDQARTPSSADIAAILALCRDWLTDFPSYRAVSAKTCFYDVAAEERFLLAPYGRKGWLMSGFSGHGFKFAPLLGQKLVAAMNGDLTPAALADWAAGRL